MLKKKKMLIKEAEEGSSQKVKINNWTVYGENIS